MRVLFIAMIALMVLVGCSRSPDKPPRKVDPIIVVPARGGIVTISGDDSISGTLTWQPPAVEIATEDVANARKRARQALKNEDLYAGRDSAIPLYIALLKQSPDDKALQAGLASALSQVIKRGDESLARSGDDIAMLREAHLLAAIARASDGDDPDVQAYLARVDVADQLWELNRVGEQALADGKFGEGGGGALASFGQALVISPGQPRAMQGQAAVESAMIRRAEVAAEGGDFTLARRWLAHASKVRPGMQTVADADARIERMRSARIARLRDTGIAALLKGDGLSAARRHLADILLIARPGDAVAAELRDRIELAEHYGLFRPGQAFTDALKNGGRGPQLVVVPHGSFTMGAADLDSLAADNERPQRTIRFNRGFAISVNEVTVGDYRRFINATGYRTRAERRGYSMVYDPRTGNFAMRSNINWRSDYYGAAAAENLPVLHVSAKDAEAYVEWLAAQSGKRYRLPSEAEFEYVLRAGSDTTYAWGNGQPPPGAGNFTGSKDRSRTGRRWGNAFPDYGDGYWGPAPVGSFAANRWGVDDMAGNAGEWVADCWHASYRRAPKDGVAWVNPGCRTRVVRGGSWASSPAQTRSTWRAPAGVDSTSAKTGFRVVREI